MIAETGLNKKDICWLSSQEDNHSSLPEERGIDTEWQKKKKKQMFTSIFCFYRMGDLHLSSSSPHHKSRSTKLHSSTHQLSILPPNQKFLSNYLYILHMLDT